MTDRVLAWTVLASLGLHVAAFGALATLKSAHADAPPAPVAVELLAVAPPPAREPVVRRPPPAPPRLVPPKAQPVETMAEARTVASEPPAPAPAEESPPPAPTAPTPDLVPDAARPRAPASAQEPRGADRSLPAFASAVAGLGSAFIPGAVRTDKGDGLFKFPVSASTSGASGVPTGSPNGQVGRPDGVAGGTPTGSGTSSSASVASGTGDGPLTAFVRPLGGYQRKPRYPEWARRQGIEGVTHLRFEVLTTGTVGQVLVERSAGNAELDQAAVESIKSWRFEPARRGTESVKVWVTMPVRFSLVTP